MESKLVFILLSTLSFNVAFASGVRLVDPETAQPTTSRTGLLQLRINHVWKFVCDDVFDRNDAGANVACRDLGYPRGGTHTDATLPTQVFGVSGDDFYDDVFCDGTESSLFECSINTRSENCDIHDAVLLMCLGDSINDSEPSEPVPAVKSRLVDANGNIRSAGGFLQMYASGTWKYICDDFFDQNNHGANVACREMGFARGTHSDGTAPRSDFFDNVQCTGSETSLAHCSFSTNHNCGRSEAVVLACIHDTTTSTEAPPATPAPAVVPAIKTRLLNNDGTVGSGSNGLLQMWAHNEWRYVCDDVFDRNQRGSLVACRELGYSHGTHSRDTTVHGVGHLFWDNVSCNGHEASLAECAFTSQEDCAASEAVRLSCSNDSPTEPTTLSTARTEPATLSTARLVNILGQVTANPNGILQMAVNGVWKYVCDDYFDRDNRGAMVACREMGYQSGEFWNEATNLPSGVSTSMFWDDVRCTGTEVRLADCSRSSSENCGRNEAVTIVCTGNRGTDAPTHAPTFAPTSPTGSPSLEPTQDPTHHPTVNPTQEPTQSPTQEPTVNSDCRFEPVKFMNCPPTPITKNLPDCSEAMSEGEFCEASAPLSDGTSNFNIDNCDGIYDVFRYICTPIVEKSECRFELYPNGNCEQADEWDLPTCHRDMFDGGICVSHANETFEVDDSPNCGSRFVFVCNREMIPSARRKLLHSPARISSIKHRATRKF